ncbi:hypothetical protein JKY72_04455 [Candidatus Gracilibacteria bacterium]|nr:hypothetical protein [Candidatus Gracilibacteria bacterium]
MLSLMRLRKFAASIVLTAMLSQSAFAGTFYVDINGDNDPDTCVENESDNDNDCTFRDALSQVSDGDTITFMENTTITAASGYTLATPNVTIQNGGFTADIDGNGTSADGLTITSAADGSTVKGLILRGWSGAGIDINSGADGITIGGLDSDDDLVVSGLQSDESTVDANVYGLFIQGTNVIVRGSVFSGNTNDGIYIGNGAADIRIEGNAIGTSGDGSTDKGNGDNGIEIDDGGSGSLNLNSGESDTLSGNNQVLNGLYIGDYQNDSGENLKQNNISGNAGDGITFGSSTSGDDIKGTVEIMGNAIGTTSDFNTAMGNDTYGIFIDEYNTSLNVTIGTDGDGTNDANEGNNISDNGNHGIFAEVSGTLIIAGNIIGLVDNGTANYRTDAGNEADGINAYANNLRIGSDNADANEYNTVSNSTDDGIEAAGPTVTVAGNYIGFDPTGVGDQGNGGAGILINDDETVTLNIGTANGRNYIGNNGEMVEKVQLLWMICLLLGQVKLGIILLVWSQVFRLRLQILMLQVVMVQVSL